MAIFIALAIIKFYSAKYFNNARVNWVGQNFVHEAKIFSFIVYPAKPLSKSTICSFLLAPSSAPANVMVTSISSTGFLLSWIDPPPEHHNGVIRNYSIIVRELNTGHSIQLVSHTTHQSFDSLHPNYNYSIQIAAVTVVAGPYSPEYYVTTLSDSKTYHFFVQ